jgi:hypothetical protein
MEIKVYEIEPGVLVKLKEEEANKLGVKEYIKPATPQKNKAMKPQKAKQEEVVINELEQDIDG